MRRGRDGAPLFGCFVYFFREIKPFVTIGTTIVVFIDFGSLYSDNARTITERANFFHVDLLEQTRLRTIWVRRKRHLEVVETILTSPDNLSLPDSDKKVSTMMGTHRTFLVWDVSYTNRLIR